MFFLFALSVCALSITNAHFIDITSYTDGATLFSLNIMLIAGCAAFSNNSMRHRSVIDVFFIWAFWILITDWVDYVPSVLAAIESSAFSILAAWVYFRPYKHLSRPPNTENVCIAFYGGPNTPFLSRIAAQLGFPFSSVAISCGHTAVRPSKTKGVMVKTTTTALEAKGYVFIDTGVLYSPEIHSKLMTQVAGTKTGYGLFRFKCMQNLKPILDCLGQEWLPKFPILPSLYFQQCVRNAK